MNELDPIALGKALKATRQEHHLTQQELADKVHISRSLLAKFEVGTRKLDDQLLAQLLDCLLSDQPKLPIEGIIDYLTIHFFSNDYQTLVKEVLGITMNHMVFHESATLGYTGRYTLLNAIDIRISQDPSKGTLFELKGKGCHLLAGWLKARKEAWPDFIRKVFAYHGNFTRIDLTMDDYEGLLDLPVLAQKIERNEFVSTFRIGDIYQSKRFNEYGFTRNHTLFRFAQKSDALLFLSEKL